MGTLSRRHWLSGLMLGGLGLAARAGEPGQGGTAQEVAEVQALTRKAGLRNVRSSETEHYLGVGDAPDDVRASALEILEKLAAAYREHFRYKGFSVEFPARRLTIITLKDKSSYEKLEGEPIAETVGGHYDLDTNRLVIFDFRADPGAKNRVAESLNSTTLVHEGLHQFTFNTGLLDRKSDVPDWVSEGLATYGELWRASGRAKFGQPNRLRLDVLREQPNSDSGWVSLEALVTDDQCFNDPKTVQVAYAESWLCVHYLMTKATQLPKFRAYLDAIRPRRDASRRLEDANAHLGDLDMLDRALKKHAQALM